MKRIKKKIFLGIFAGSVGVLSVIKAVTGIPATTGTTAEQKDSCQTDTIVQIGEAALSRSNIVATRGKTAHPIYSVHSYQDCFPDVQDVQIVSARKWGVRPVLNREQAEKRKNELVYVGMNPFYKIDTRMQSSIPYLVPRAALLLEQISRNYLDSLYLKDIPLHRLIVTSVLRTEEDVAKLRKHNGNASAQSCHRFGTTFDICYNRYETVCPPGENRRAVQNDTLKWVLSEVLRDARQEGLCHIKYEVKQGCFHITVK